MKNNKHVESFGEFNENLNISDVMNSKIMENSDEQTIKRWRDDENFKKKNTKMEKLKDLLELISEVDIMYHEERKEYFFEWMKDDEFITIWLGDYV